MPKLKRLNEWHFKNGAADEIRTHDLFITRTGRLPLPTTIRCGYNV